MFEMMLGTSTVTSFVGKQVVLAPPGVNQKVPVVGFSSVQVSADTGIYFCLGNDIDGTPVRNLWYYQFTSNQWFDLGAVPTAMVGVYGTMGYIDNKLYWVCDELVFSYAETTQLWTRHKDIVTATLRGYGQTSFVWNGELYVYGEVRTGSGVYLKKYTPSTDTWFAVSTSPVTRNIYGNGVVVGDIAYFFSGVTRNRMVTYNLLTKIWRVVDLTWTMASFPVVVYNDGYIYISTGAANGDVQRYEISSDTFAPLPKLQNQRSQSGGGFYDGKMYIWGGSSSGLNQRTMLTYQL